MKAPDPSATPPPPDDSSTSLPGLRSWALVYLLVLASFAIWVGLLIALEILFK